MMPSAVESTTMSFVFEKSSLYADSILFFKTIPNLNVLWVGHPYLLLGSSLA
jgi:hypothetical protein